MAALLNGHPCDAIQCRRRRLHEHFIDTSFALAGHARRLMGLEEAGLELSTTPEGEEGPASLTLTDPDAQLLQLCCSFSCRVTEALADQFGVV